MKNKNNGFTLIEMLVVVGIMLSILGITIGLLSALTRGDRVKKGASIAKSVLSSARSFATKERRVFFVYFDIENHQLSLFRDSNNNKILDLPSGPEDSINDERMTQEPSYSLPRFIQFYWKNEDPIDQDPPPIFAQGDPSKFWIGFNTDGSVIFPDGVSDASLIGILSNPEEAVKYKLRSEIKTSDADVVIWQQGEPRRAFLDIIPQTGKVRPCVYIDSLE